MKKISTVIALLLAALLLLGSCSSQDPDAPNGMKTISNENVDYYLYVPNTWVEDSSTRFVSAYVSDTDRTNISMEAFELEDYGTTLDDFWTSYEEDFASTFGDMEYVSQDTMLLGGIAANKYVYTAKVTGVEFKFMQVTAIREGTVYIFTYTAAPAKYDEHIDAVETILASISFK